MGLGDGVGGSDFSLVPGSPLTFCCEHIVGERYYCKPSCLVNVWMTTNEEMARFSAWCYDTDVATAKAHMQLIQSGVKP